MLVKKFSRQGFKFVADNALISIFIISTFVISVVPQDDILAKWWEIENNLKDLFQTVEKISSTVDSKSRIISVDESTVWFVKGFEIMSNFRLGDHHSFDYVPISESFEKYKQTVVKKSNVIISKYDQRNEKNNIYKKYLQNFGLDPKNISSLSKNFGIITTIVAQTYSMRSIIPVITFILRWAIEEEIKIENALEVVTLTRPHTIQPIKFLFSANKGKFKVLSCRNVWSNYILDAISTRVDEGPYYDRLMPKYPVNDWNKPFPKFTEEHKHQLNSIIFALTKYAKKYLLENFNQTVVVDETTKNFLILRNPPYDIDLPPMNFEMPFESLSHSGTCNSRVKRQLIDTPGKRVYLFDNPVYLILTYNTSQYGYNILNREVYNTLREEYAAFSGRISFINFIREELEYPESTANEILNLSCKKYQESSTASKKYNHKTGKITIKDLNEL